MSTLLILSIISGIIFLIMLSMSLIFGYRIKKMSKEAKLYPLYGFYSSIFFDSFSDKLMVILIRVLLIINFLLLCLLPFINILLESVELYFSYQGYKIAEKEFCEKIMNKLMG